MEKRTPHYDLQSIQAAFCAPEALRITRSAQDTAFALGFTRSTIVAVIQGMTRPQFYKSMTAYANSAIWHDVYHVPHDVGVLYVKFTTDGEGFFLTIGFKAK